MVQWLRLHTPNAGGLGLIPAQGTRSHMLQLKILHATTKKILQVSTKVEEPQCRTRTWADKYIKINIKKI